MEQVKDAYDKWGALLILVKGVTHIPLKLVTIVSGLQHYNLLQFVLCCAITRGARLLLLAGGLNLFGDSIRAVLQRYFGWFRVLMVAFIGLGIYAAAKLVYSWRLTAGVMPRPAESYEDPAMSAAALPTTAL